MISVKEILKRQWDEYHKLVLYFALKDVDTNDEDYNYGRHEIVSNERFSLLDNDVAYYCMCNNLNLRDVSGGIDTVFTQ